MMACWLHSVPSPGSSTRSGVRARVGMEVPKAKCSQLQGERVSEEAWEGARDSIPRVQGGSQLLGGRVSLTHCQVPRGSGTTILEACK